MRLSGKTIGIRIESDFYENEIFYYDFRFAEEGATVRFLSRLWGNSGITFEGHPNLVPLLLPDDMTDHFPLRKENPLQEIMEWQGENLREGAGEEEE